MIKYFLLSLLIISTSYAQINNAGGPHNYIEQKFDVLEYRPIITIEDHKSKFIRGDVNIKLEWKNVSDDNYFNFHYEDLTIDSIFYDDIYIPEIIVTTNSETEGILYYSIKPINDNKQATIRIVYHGTMTSEGGSNDWGGVHYSQGILYAMGVGFFNDYVSCTRHWMPSFDLPSDKARYTGTFIVPDSLMAISNGKLLSKVDTLDGMSKYTWTLGDDLAATYLLTFAIGKFAEIDIPTEGKPPVKLYMYDNQNSIASGKLVFKLVPEMIKAFEQFFDYDYPFETMGYYAASKGAMEHQTLVTMSQNQIVGKANAMDTIYSTAAHELGHQWFGNLVTPYDFRDAWLNEGFAVFTEYVWIESKLGKDKYKEELMKLRSSYINSTAKAEQHIPLYNFHRFSKNNYPSTIYQKGGLILALIRDIVGDEIFKTKINEYLTTYENANTNTEELIAIFNDELPQSFWETWVYGRGFPEVDITTFQDDEYAYVVVSQRENEFQTYEFDLFYEVIFENEIKYLTHKITNAVDTLITERSSNLKGVEINDNLYLYKVMSNNRLTSVDEEFETSIYLKNNIIDNELELNFGKASNYNIEIVTLDGRKVFIESGEYFGFVKFNLSSLVAGTYFVYIRSNDNNTMKKIIVR